MLNFKLSSSELYAKNPSSDPTVIPAGSVLFYANTDLQWDVYVVGPTVGSLPNYKKSWTREFAYPQIIKAVDINYAGIRYNPSYPNYVYFTTVSSGAHNGTYTLDTARFNSGTTTYLSNASGAGVHAHAVQLESPYPKSIQITTYVSNIETSTIPKDTILFTNTPTSDYNLVTGTYINDACLVAGANSWYVDYNWKPGQAYGKGSYTGTYDLNNSVTYFDGRGQTGRTITNAGTHTHQSSSATTGSIVTNTNYPYSWLDRPAVPSAGSHNHTPNAQVAYSIRLKKTKLKAYITNKNTPVSNGIIIGYKGGNILPPNWYFCNGQVVGSYTTPNLIDRYIETTTTTHNQVIEVTNNLNCNVKFSSTTYNPHSHWNPSGTSFVQVSSVAKASINYHADYDWAHNHDGSVDIDFEPSYYGLAFIIYLINT